MGTSREAVIIGAGVGGLAAANALYRTGWQVTVLERADALRPIGAGIAMPPNAMHALDAVAADAEGMDAAGTDAATLGARVRAVGMAGGAIGARRPDGRWIFKPTGNPVGRRFGYPVYSLARTELLAVFAGQLPGDTIRFDTVAQVADPGSADRRAQVQTAAGEVIEADLVVAADGGRSAVRRALFPDHPGPADGGYTIWWMLAPSLGDKEEVVASESLGKGTVWGTWALADGRVYAYATVLKRFLTANGGPAADPLSQLRAHFAGWYPQVQRILEAVDPASVYRDDARWMQTPLPAYHAGRVALLGDAAHPMTPDLGQGGSQSIEDAVVLAKVLAAADGDPRALASYSTARLPRTMDIVKRSKRMAAFHHASTPVGMFLRDQALRLSSSERTVGLFLRSFDPVFGWKP
jgi:2-polyprenyl-6-methoxyphenol hydroxylase-like FAD-dependent oxidoreductase